ncbi:MAG TPA: GNAT family protein [Thermomicrobiales bacterium]|nr:GNAT family protein [Thermomicrobiales bacterium]
MPASGYSSHSQLTRTEVAHIVEQRVQQNHLTDQGDILWLATELKASGEMVGSVHLAWLSQEHAQGEVGYRLHPDHWGQGYASEAVRTMLAYGFRDLDLHRIIGTCDDHNEPSRRLLERIGMRQEAHFREIEWIKGEWRSQLVYAILRGEWESSVNP